MIGAFSLAALFAGMLLLGSDSPINPPCGDIEGFTDPAVCLSTPNVNLTLDRKSGRISVYVSAAGNRWTASPVGLDVRLSTPSNVSGVKLLSGEGGSVVHLEVSSSKPIKNYFLQQIETSPDNPTSGRLLYFIDGSSDNPKVKVLGTPIEISVVTSP